MQKKYISPIIVLLVMLTSFSSHAQSDDDILRLCPTNIDSLAWSPSGETFAIQNFQGAVIYDQGYEPQAYFNEDYREIFIPGVKQPNKYFSCGGAGIAWHPDETYLAATPFYDPNNGIVISIWDVTTAQEVSQLLTTATTTSDIKWSANGNQIAVSLRHPFGTASWYISIWRLENLSMTSYREFAYSPFAITAIDWNPNNNGSLANASENGQVNIWDTNATYIGMTDEEDLIKEFLISYEAHEGAANDLAWNPVGNRVASVGDDGNIFLWDFENKTALRTIEPYAQ